MNKKKQTRLDKFVSFLSDNCWLTVTLITLIAFVCVTVSVIRFWPHGVLTGFLVVLFGGIILPAETTTILVASLISLIDLTDRRQKYGKKNKK